MLDLFTSCISLGIPTDEEQATGLEKIIMNAMKEGTVRTLVKLWICDLF